MAFSFSFGDDDDMDGMKEAIVKTPVPTSKRRRIVEIFLSDHDDGFEDDVSSDVDVAKTKPTKRARLDDVKKGINSDIQPSSSPSLSSSSSSSSRVKLSLRECSKVSFGGGITLRMVDSRLAHNEIFVNQIISAKKPNETDPPPTTTTNTSQRIPTVQTHPTPLSANPTTDSSKQLSNVFNTTTTNNVSTTTPDITTTATTTATATITNTTPTTTSTTTATTTPTTSTATTTTHSDQVSTTLPSTTTTTTTATTAAATVSSDVLHAAALGSDLVPLVYEGGMKVWEGTGDLCNVLARLDHDFANNNNNNNNNSNNYDTNSNNNNDNNDNNNHYHHNNNNNNDNNITTTTTTKNNNNTTTVIELGCGAGIPGIYMRCKGALVDFQDYNEEVLQHITCPNVVLNPPPSHMSSAVNHTPRFLSGDWSNLVPYLKEQEAQGKAKATYDMVISSETLYSTDSIAGFYSVLQHVLAKPHGKAYIASKTYYFGVGGGTRDFIALVEQEQHFNYEVLFKSVDGVHREVIELSWKS